ncbi:putative retinol dehydrogenase 14 [Mycobacterium xenopi 3993]|nr:putative retinol dehydrogenase 14 [Mycobacterium xenopi 3993]
MTTKIEMTEDGYEKTFQVNYLAPFLLTTQLLDLLVDSRASVINTSSASQKLLGKVSVEDLENTHRCRPSKVYALTKLAIILFTKELHRRYHDAGLSAVAFHPGMSTPTSAPHPDREFLPSCGIRRRRDSWQPPIKEPTSWSGSPPAHPRRLEIG